MAKLTRSHFGDITGTINDHVFYQRGGKTIIYKKPVRKRNTANQLKVKEKIAEVSRLSKAFKPMRKIGIEPKYLKNMNRHNFFNKINYSNLSQDAAGNTVIDYSNISLGKGTLNPPGSLSRIVSGETIIFNWNAKGRGEPTDKIHFAAFNPELKQIELLSEAERSLGETSFKLPSHWEGHPVHFYAFARNHNKNVSDTVYCGEMNEIDLYRN